MASTYAAHNNLQPTGIDGLDRILGGGLMPGCLFLVEGDPGSGKTTLALQFLMHGVSQGEKGLLITLSEAESEIRRNAETHGWDLKGVEILEVQTSDEPVSQDSRYTMFHPAEIELTQIMQRVLSQAKQNGPVRLVFDSLSSLRLLSQGSLRFRRQVMSIKSAFGELGCTVLLVDDMAGEHSEIELHSLCHGVIKMHRISPEYGAMRRRLQVLKMRGMPFREGLHDFNIKTGGLEVYPRLIASEHLKSYERAPVSSGIPPLDDLLGGGMSRGTSNLLMGPAGTGKSSIASQYAAAAARRGETASFYMFDESLATFLERSRGLGLDLEKLQEAGKLNLRQIDPAEMSPGEFAYMIVKDVEDNNTKVVVIDSLNGFLNAMSSEKLLNLHLHELLTYLGNRGVTTLMIMAQHGLLGPDPVSPVDTSYLADTVLMLRFFEVAGNVRQAISVIKKRTGSHERSIREISFSEEGLKLGEPLKEFQGVMRGTPLLLNS